jgi:bifunctional non-homologous end joining protein LigD
VDLARSSHRPDRHLPPCGGGWEGGRSTLDPRGQAMKADHPLADYQAKRNFTKTAEPSGTVAKSKSNLRFVVQKHDATRLHYDFRVELDGVLKSWAVTRGPSTDPADKRLAVRVEDHPLDYGSFEGTIPEGEYGGGTVMLWDEGVWEPVGDPHEGLADGDLKFTLKGKRMKGEWVLVHMKGRDSGKRENWLLIKHRDRYATEAGGLTEKFTTSVSTGRDLAGIARGLKSRKRSPKAKAAPATKRKSPAKLTGMQLTDDMGIAIAERLKVRLTSPTRPVLPGETVTKAQIVAYYEAVAERMLPHIENRALSLVRVPHGSKPFFQKHDTGGFPDAVKRVAIELKESDREDHFYVTDLAGILGGVQMSTLEFHIWGSRIKTLEKPDRIVFDIDPDEDLDFAAVRRGAIDIRDRLDAIGLKSFAMATGGKGIHVIAPLKPRIEWPEVKQFCHDFADRLATDEPDRFTANIRKAKREGRMFVDYLRNERGSTAIAPWSTRGRKGVPCAMPVGWDEVETLKAANLFGLEAAADRAGGPDPWPDYFKLSQSITKAMIKAVAGDKA